MSFLQRLLPGDEHASLLGDIQEEARRRSRLWYWWQLVTVLVVCSNRDARKHPLLVLRAVVIGFITLLVYFQEMVLPLMSGDLYVGHYWLLRFPAVFTIIALGFALSGWMVARANRSFGIAMVVPYVRVVGLLGLAFSAQLVLTSLHPTAMPLGRAIWTISTMGVMLASILGTVIAGAMLGTRRRPASHA